MPRGMGGPHGRNMAGEKAKDFKGTIKKLIRYMSAFKVHMFFVAVFAVCSTVFNIVGPKILGKATWSYVKKKYKLNMPFLRLAYPARASAFSSNAA